MSEPPPSAGVYPGRTTNPKTGNQNNDALAVESHIGKSTRWPFRLTTGKHPARESPALVTLGGISVESSETRCHTRRRVFSWPQPSESPTCPVRPTV